MFLAVITSATDVGNTRPSSPTSESVSQIHDVSFFCLTSPLWDESSLNGDAPPNPGYGDQNDMYYSASGSATPAPEHPCQPLRKLISTGTFYYASDPQWDISSRLQRRLARTEPWDASIFDDRFVWNEYIIRSLLDFRERLDPQERAELDQCQFIVSMLFRHFSRHERSDSYVGTSYSGIRWCMHARAACTTNKWHPCRGDTLAHIQAGMEARRNTVQHTRSRR